MTDTSMYVTLSRQTAVSRELDLVANNLANLSTTGFKAERMLFDRALKQAGAADPVSFVIDRATYTDHQAGGIVETSGDLDLAILGEGYFAIETPNGERYTRDGRFVVAPTGQLSALDGSPVLDQGNAPIQIPEEATNITIANDGSVNVDDVEVGRIGVYTFANEDVLVRDGASRFRADGAVPQAAEFPQLKQGALEASNVDPIREITRMIELTRAFEQGASMNSTVHDQKKTAVQRLGEVR